jgi:guanylate kinase
MQRLVIIGGASGAGKSFLLERLTEVDPTLVSIRKLSTRRARPSEELASPSDLEVGQSVDTVRSCDYWYTYGTDLYGIRKVDVDDALARGQSPVVIVRKSATIQQLCEAYERPIVLYLQSALSGYELVQKLRELGRRDIDMYERAERLRLDFQEYVNYINLFDAVIINYYDHSLFEQLHAVLWRLTRSPA